MKILLTLVTMALSFFSLLAVIIVAKGFGFSPASFHDPEKVFDSLTFITSVLVLILPIGITLFAQKVFFQGRFDRLGFKQPVWRLAVGGFLGGAFLKGMATLVAFYTSEGATLTFDSAPSFLGWLPYFSWFFAALILNSLNEELAYRTFPISNLEQSSFLRNVLLVVATSTVFSLMHFLIEPPEAKHFFYRFAFGNVAGLLFLMNRSLWSIVGLHTGWNFLALTVGDADWRVGNLIKVSGVQHEILFNIGVLFAASLILLPVALRRRDWKPMKFLAASIVLFSLHSSSVFATEVPDEAIRVKIFDRVVSEVERIDGEGLPARKNRPESWNDTTRILREQARAAKSAVEFGQVFRKIDATYPNLHAQVVLAEKFDIAANRMRPRIGVRFAPEVVGPKQKSFRYKIGSIETDMMKDFKEAVRPAVGDELLAINRRPMAQWSRENFLYCKFPLREQCEMNFFDHFRKAFLSWDWRSPLEYTLKRNDRVWSIKVPVEIPAPGGQAGNQKSASDESQCAVDADRYEGFKPVYKGLNICAFESPASQNVTVLRISSFRYREIPKESKIQSLKDEVDQFYDGYWKAKAPISKKIIIDVIDNGGGDTPIEWYKVFYDKPFQEQFVEFKKLREIDDDRIRKDLFYEDNGKEIWFSDLKKSGAYDKVKIGQFLPPVPQFCASEDQSCAKGLFKPRSHGFKGQVRVLVNEWCISTCTGFVWSMKDQLRSRTKLIGVPDSGDSAYARLYLDVYLDENNPDGFRVEIAPRPGRTRQNLPDGAILRQQVTATRSTDSRGRVISATPTTIDSWIPYRYRNFDESWESKVFKAALAD